MLPSPCGGSSWQGGRGVRGRRGAEPAGLRSGPGPHRQVCDEVRWAVWDDGGVSTVTDLTPGRPVNAPLPLLVLGAGRDLASERGVECPGDLPAPSDPGPGRAGPRRQGRARRPGLRPRPPLPARRGHRVRRRHRRLLQAGPGGRRTAGRAVHRLLRCALHGRVGRHPHRRPSRQVILPDLAAGCSMADMAAISQVEDAWDDLVDAGRGRRRRAGDLHELLRGDQGVHRPPRRHGLHLRQRRGPRCSGRSTRAAASRARQGAVPARPAPRPQHRRARPRPLARRLRRLRPAPPERRADPRAAAATPG